MCHPEPYEGTLREYRLCVIPSGAEGSLSEYCQDLNRDPSKARVVLPCLQRVKRARRNRRHMGASLLCHFEGARRFTLLARGKTSAPQSAAYGRMPMATCCRKRRLFRRRLLRGGCAAAPLRVTQGGLAPFKSDTGNPRRALCCAAPFAAPRSLLHRAKNIGSRTKKRQPPRKQRACKKRSRGNFRRSALHSDFAEITA